MRVETDTEWARLAYDETLPDELTAIVVESFIREAADFVFDSVDDDLQDALQIYAEKSACGGGRRV